MFFIKLQHVLNEMKDKYVYIRSGSGKCLIIVKRKQTNTQCTH